MQPGVETIRWEVDLNDVQDTGTGSLLASPEKVFGGLKWHMKAYSETSERTANQKVLQASIWCSYVQVREYWKCDHRSSVTLVHRSDEEKHKTVKFTKSFSAEFISWGTTLCRWDEIFDDNKGYASNGKVILEMKIEIEKSFGVRDVSLRRDFSVAGQLDDVCLVVEGQKFHVSRTMLSVHSPVFKAMLLGSFEEADKAEVELQIIRKEDFTEFLHVIYTSVQEINDFNVEGILEIADQYQVKFVLDAVECFLMRASRIPTSKKLQLSDSFKLELLQVYLMTAFRTLNDIKHLEFDPLFRDFSAELKARICDRTMELIPFEVAACVHVRVQ